MRHFMLRVLLPILLLTLGVFAITPLARSRTPQSSFKSPGGCYIPFISQKNPQWANEKLGFGTGPNETIYGKGCALTSATMILNARSPWVCTDPYLLNSWLKANGGYDFPYILRWHKPAERDGMHDGLTWESVGSLPQTPSGLKNMIDNGKFIIAYSTRYLCQPLYADHWVVIRGYSGSGQSWWDFLYWDPSDANPVYRTVYDGWVMPGCQTRVYR